MKNITCAIEMTEEVGGMKDYLQIIYRTYMCTVYIQRRKNVLQSLYRPVCYGVCRWERCFEKLFVESACIVYIVFFSVFTMSHTLC